MEKFDIVVIGGGVIGISIAYHLARFGCRRVLLLERGQLGSGTTAQSSCILRTHYSVPENVVLAKAALAVFNDFPAYLDDPEAESGYNRCGMMLVAGDGPRASALRETLAVERGLGIDARELTVAEARRIHPLVQFDDIAAIGWEPEAGFADAYLTLHAFARAARKLGVTLREGIAVTGLTRRANGRVVGVETSAGTVAAGLVISAQNIWSQEVTAWTGIALPLTLSRHTVFTLEAPAPYPRDLPILKDLKSPGKLYMRSYGGRQLLVGDGNEGEEIATADIEQADVPLDYVAEIGEQVAHRMPVFATAGLAASWTGVYDVTPDWNPVLGTLPGVGGLQVAYGFSGHGFKLSPIVGRMVAQGALGLAPDFPLEPYSLSRFSGGRLLQGRYGAGAVS